MQDLSLGLVELQEFTDPTSQSCQGPSGNPSLQHDYHTTELGVINKLAEGALESSGRVTNKDSAKD